MLVALWAPSAANDDDLVQRRLLLVLELGPVVVVTPGTKRCGEPDPGGAVVIETCSGQVDHDLRLAGREQARHRSATQLFRSLTGRASVPMPTTSTRRTVPPSSTNCSATLDASPSNRCRSRAPTTVC